MVLDVIIVDDEAPARKELTYLLQDYDEINIIGEAASGKEAIQKILKLDPDVVFLDIRMWDMNGFDVAERLISSGSCPFIIFVTAYDQYAVTAFEINAIDYILKPVSSLRMEKTINRVKSIFKSKKNQEAASKVLRYVKGLSEKTIRKKFTFEKNNRLHVIDAKNICYCKASPKGSIVKTSEEIFKTPYTLSELENSTDNLFRSHKSFLVNINKIKEIIPWFNGTYLLLMEDCENDKIPVSRRNSKKLKNLFKI